MRRRCSGPGEGPGGPPAGWLAGLLAAAVLVAGCSTAAPAPEPAGGEAARPSGSPSAPTRAATQDRVVEVSMPRAYTASAQGSSTDDYRCFLLDPGLAEDTFVTGVDVAPGNAHLVHHVILFRVPPRQVAAARAVDARDPGEGWTCFGGSGLEEADAALEDAPWLGAWAPGSGESRIGHDVGIPLEGGSRIVMQVHYNLLAGSEPDRSSARLRVAPGSADLEPLETTLLPAPVELPCRPSARGRLCDRDAALVDLMERFGQRSAAMVMGLQLLCGDGRGVEPGPTQSCRREIGAPATVRAVAGHMHLLGRSIRIRHHRRDGSVRTLLDIPVWDFDDQGTRPLERPARIRRGDALEVTCTHDQGLRDLLPAFDGQPERYVLWGEGTTDEMCLGIALVTRS